MAAPARCRQSTPKRESAAQTKRLDLESHARDVRRVGKNVGCALVPYSMMAVEGHLIVTRIIAMASAVETADFRAGAP